MGTHKSSDAAARKAKYQRQAIRTEANKRKHIAKMKEKNPNWPAAKTVDTHNIKGKGKNG